jgi:hypothetical protein
MQIRSLSESELAEALANLERCLEGLEQNGEEGLQRALDRIYPTTGLRSVWITPGIHATVSTKPFGSRPYDSVMDG